MTRYICCDERRRNAIAGLPGINGLDFLEVRDYPGDPLPDRQRTLFVHFINDPSGLVLGPANVRIEGGERIRDIRVSNAIIAIDPRSFSTRPVLVVQVEAAGDFSIYTLRLVEDTAQAGRLATIDPILRAVDFSFKVACDSGFDASTAACAPPRPASPALDYTARDFRALRQMLLDRAATLSPEWTERNAADLGITLLELFASVGDHLAYRQDAVAAEAYLDTARRRVSVRRHARLVDYRMHDGCAARLFAHVAIEGGTLALPVGTKLLTAAPGLPERFRAEADAYRRALSLGAEVFETLGPARLDPMLNTIPLHAWGDRRCCLPRGAVKATLRGDVTAALAAGDWLLFEEVRGPRTGDADDADPAHRQVVRLTRVEAALDPIGRRFEDPPADGAVTVTEIEWAAEDALRFPLCLSDEADAAFGGAFVDGVSIARGNLVLADHGRTLPGEEDLGTVPRPALSRRAAVVPAASSVSSWDTLDGCGGVEREPFSLRFRPRLREAPLLQAVPWDAAAPPASAAAALAPKLEDAVPAVLRLESRDEAGGILRWVSQRDLLSSGDRPDFVVETEDDGAARLRFGDGEHGDAPPVGARFAARYRVGGGRRGNIGADCLAHLASADGTVLAETLLLRVSNPLPASGGANPETKEEVRRRAPFAFRVQDRAVTPADYAARAGLHPAVQRAASSLRWTGSWRTHFISVDRAGGAPVDDGFEAALVGFLEPFRLAGHDVEIDRPRLVALELGLSIRVQPTHFRADIRRAVLEVLGTRAGPDGRLGVFHPDRLSFGQTVYLSPIVAAVQAVEGVESVRVTLFQRRDQPGPKGAEDGKLTFSRLEIGRLDNDPNFPEHGSLALTLEGGR